jgi:hypothetical protein
MVLLRYSSNGADWVSIAVLTIYQLPMATAASPAMVLNEGGTLISIKVGFT